MVKVKVPATTANVGPGFDSLGIALTLYNEIEVEEINSGLSIEVKGRDSEKIDTDENNLVYKSMIKTFNEIGYDYKGLKIKQYNNIPIGRGLGSSAASIIGAIVAANKLAGNVLTQDEILDIAVEIEGHPDNVAPALFGGVVVSCSDNNHTNYIKFPVDERLKFIVAIPEVILSTKDSRNVLPKKVTFEDAVFNLSRSSLLVASLMSGDLEKLDIALQDRLHQPYRIGLLNSLKNISKEAKKQGLNRVFLSGAGPSVIYITWDMEDDEDENKFYNIIKKLPEEWSIQILKGDNKGII